jgi:hypothetical protein
MERLLSQAQCHRHNPMNRAIGAALFLYDIGINRIEIEIRAPGTRQLLLQTPPSSDYLDISSRIRIAQPRLCAGV